MKQNWLGIVDLFQISELMVKQWIISVFKHLWAIQHSVQLLQNFTRSATTILQLFWTRLSAWVMLLNIFCRVYLRYIVAQWLVRWICNPEVPSSSPPPCHEMDLCLVVPDSIPLRFVNSQLVSLPAVGIFNKFLFNFRSFPCPTLVQ